MPDSKQSIVRKLDKLLNDFLIAYAVKRLDRLQVKQQISVKYIKLPEIKIDSESSEQSSNRDINDRLKDSLVYQSKMMEYFQKTDQHPFTVVDNLLKSIENNPDIKANHMAASVLYFLKLNGYKVAPYVERLRKLGKNENE